MTYEIITSSGELYHHGIAGQKWGVSNGPPYPLSAEKHDKVVDKAKKANTKLENAKRKAEKRKSKQVEAKQAKYKAVKQNYTTQATKYAAKEAKYNVKAHKVASRPIFPNPDKAQLLSVKAEGYKWRKEEALAKAKSYESKLQNLTYRQMSADSKVKYYEAKVDKYLKQLGATSIKDLED